jgi:hypothetical protein
MSLVLEVVVELELLDVVLLVLGVVVLVPELLEQPTKNNVKPKVKAINIFFIENSPLSIKINTI